MRREALSDWQSEDDAAMGSIGRRGFLIGAAAALSLTGGAVGRLGAALAQAETWPARPIKFIVPLAAGGGLDFVARIIGDYLTRELGQQIYVENRTGAGGTIGIDAAIKSPPDGYSLLATNDNVASAPHVLALNVDYLKDLMPVVELGRQPQSIAVHPTLGVASLDELIAMAKRTPGMGVATSGVGTNQHVLLEWFSRETGVKLDHVPYRGAGQAINDLVAGHVKIGFLGPTAVLPHYQAGTLRMLAQTGPRRGRTMPEIPTLQELGYQVALESWYAVFAPLGTPQAVVARLNVAINKGLADAGTQGSFGKGATEPTGGTPEELGRFAREDSDKYARLVRELNIRTR
jgi:tripartite-type tricarboxylate transporter receptor subunit TctC